MSLVFATLQTNDINMVNRLKLDTDIEHAAFVIIFVIAKGPPRINDSVLGKRVLTYWEILGK